MKRALSWIHLSDLHLRSGDQYDQRVVLASLLNDIDALRDRGDVADCIFLTGDLVFSGKSEEYHVVTQFLGELSRVSAVPFSRIYCVPGNHDVDRARLTAELHAEARSLSTRQQVSELLGSVDRLRLADRYSAYTTFVRKTFPWASHTDTADLSFVQNENINGISATIVGLSSAWTAGADDDKGHLLVGERQVREALERSSQPDIIVVLIHHPFSYLADFDASDVQGLLNRRSDFVLHGHLHETGAARLADPDSEVFYLAAGAAYQGRSDGLGYNLVKLDLSEGEASVFLRRYSDKQGGFWTADSMTYQSAPEGILRFRLPERLTRIPNQQTIAEVREKITIFEQGPGTVAVDPEIIVPDPPNDLVQLIQRGKCVLFVGAGASMDAKLPSWQEMMGDLVDQLISYASIGSDELVEVRQLLSEGELFVLADYCRDKMGEYDFASYLRTRLSDTNRASRTHRLLAEIPFRAALTTNFDAFLERSRSSKQVEVVLPDRMDAAGGIGVEQLLNDPEVFPVFKLHGSYKDVKSIVLTAREFRAVIFGKPKYRDALKRLFTDSTLFFYGYSFRDPSINYLLMELMADHEGLTRPHYAILPEVGPISQQYWFRNFNVRVISYGLWNGSHIAATAFLEKLAQKTGVIT